MRVSDSYDYEPLPSCYAVFRGQCSVHQLIKQHLFKGRYRLVSKMYTCTVRPLLKYYESNRESSGRRWLLYMAAKSHHEVSISSNVTQSGSEYSIDLDITSYTISLSQSLSEPRCPSGDSMRDEPIGEIPGSTGPYESSPHPSIPEFFTLTTTICLIVQSCRQKVGIMSRY